MQSPQAKLKEITRLLANWRMEAADPDEALRNYLLAVEDYPFCDVEEAVITLIKGVAPGVNPGFMPPPAVVGAECRRQMNLRLDREHRAKAFRPALPEPIIERSADERARVKAKIDAFIADQAVTPEDQAAVKRRAEQWAKTNERFHPDPDERAMAKRLGFSVGDPEDAADAA